MEKYVNLKVNPPKRLGGFFISNIKKLPNLKEMGSLLVS